MASTTRRLVQLGRDVINGRCGEGHQAATSARSGCARLWSPSRTAYPGEVTHIRAQFVNPGQYVWHCHIVEHKDNEMTRPYRIGPKQPGQPMPEMSHMSMATAQQPKKFGRRRKRRRAR